MMDTTTDITVEVRDAEALWFLVNQEIYRVEMNPESYTPAYRLALGRLQTKVRAFEPTP